MDPEKTIICTKAIIPVAGYGTRCLPITRALEKCMLPVLARPVVDYTVQDCIQAGIQDIYFVVSKGGGAQLRAYYSPQPELEAYLQANDKAALISLVQPPTGVRFHYIEQDTTTKAPYGTTVPVWLCRDIVKPGEHVIVAMGDDFMYRADGTSELHRLIEAAQAAEGGSAMLGVPVPHDQVSQYGVIATHENGGRTFFDHIQEKPSPEEAKSNLINVSKYLFDAAFFEYLDVAMSRHESQEYYITDPLNAYVDDGHQLQVVAAGGVFLDCGTTEKWLAANNFLAAQK